MIPVGVSNSPVQLACPQCRQPLRLRLRPGDAREFRCPDCRTLLQIVSGEEGISLAVATPIVAAAASVTPSVSFTTSSSLPYPVWQRMRDAAAERATDPLFVTWSIAAIAAVGIGAAFWHLQGSSPTSGPASVPGVATRSETPVTKDEAPKREVLSPTVQVPDPVEAPRIGLIAPMPIEATRPQPVAGPDLRERTLASLSRQVLRFEQPTPVPFEQLRFQLQEMTGVLIAYDVSGKAEGRNVPVTVSLKEVTMEEVLVAVAAQAGLSMAITNEGVLLSRSPANVESESNDLTTK